MLGQGIIAGFGGKDPRKLTRKEIGEDVHLRFLAETDPEAAAILHMELHGDFFLRHPTSAPIVHLTSKDISWVMLGDEGWSLMKTVEWIRAYATRLGADRYDLICAANSPGLRITSPHRERIPVLLSACEMRESFTAAIHAREIIGDEARRKADELRRDPPVDLSIFTTILSGLLPHKQIVPENDGQVIALSAA